MSALRKFRKNSSNNSNFEEKGRAFMRYTVEFREAFRKEFYRNNMAKKEGLQYMFREAKRKGVSRWNFSSFHFAA